MILTFPEEPSREYIKRVVGLPGDLVQVDQGKLKVNGQSVTQQVQQGGSGEICGVESLARGAGQIRYPVCWEPPLLSMSQPVQVGKDEVFVLGDSRGDSTDSRRTKSWGVTKLDLVKGKALFVWMSVEPPGGGRNGFFSRLRMNRFFLRVQ